MVRQHISCSKLISVSYCCLGRNLCLTCLFNPQKLESQSTYVRDPKVELTELPNEELLKSRNVAALGTVPGSLGKQVIHTRGGARPRKKSQKKIQGSKSETGKRSIKANNTRVVMKKQGVSTFGQAKGQEQVMYEQGQGHGHGRGPRTVRKRRENKTVEDMSHGNFGERGNIGVRESQRNFNDQEWAADFGKMQNEKTFNNNSTESSESDDNADPARYGNHRWDPSFKVAPHSSTWDAVDSSSDEDADGVDMNVYDEDEDNMDVDRNDGLVGNNGESSGTSGDYSD